jgi:hemolysin D
MKSLFFSDEADPLDFSPPLLRLQDAAPHPLGRRVLWVLLGLLAALLIWALIARLDIVAVAEGKLVPQTYLKIVQPADSGIVKAILVREGESVKAGQVLMRLDTQISEADTRMIDADYQRKRLTLRRIESELTGQPFMSQGGDPPALSQEIAAQYRANRSALEAALAEENSRRVKAQQDMAAAEQIRQKIELVLPHYTEQDKAYEKLVRDGFAGALMGSDKKRERLEKEQELQTQGYLIESARASLLQSEKRLAQIHSDYRRQLHAERNEIQGQLDKLAQEVAKQTHRQSLLELKASQDGVVKDLATHTVGAVVQPGTILLTLVPANDILRAEVWLSNEDIGFVREGQSVKLKFTAFPFQKYGMVEGALLHVSADAADGSAGGPSSQNETSRKDQRLRYKALVELRKMHLDMEGRHFALTAGMQAQAEIWLGDRTVMDYLLSPVKKAWHEAARER